MRARRELLFCLAGVPFVLISPPVLVVGAIDGIWWVADRGRGNPSPAEIAGAVAGVGALLVLVVTTPAAQWLGAVQRRLTVRVLGVRVRSPRPGRRRPDDAAGWRVVAYQVLKLPVGLGELFAVFLWAVGLLNLAYPLLWGAFRNHPPGTRLSPVPLLTPFGVFPVATRPGTLAAAAAGAAMLVAAPWVTRAVTSADVWLVRGLLGPRRMAERVFDLEVMRALAVNDAAAQLRRVERDLHDGAQIGLATVAMNLGMARAKLGDSGAVDDPAAVRELVGAALRGAQDTLVELRGLVRGIHPPVLDNGLADALASLVAGPPMPVELEVVLPVRPTPAIETIAYFCAAELLANAAKHSGADRIRVRAAVHRDKVVVSVADNGTGGADPAGGTGLIGLAQRAAVVDGRVVVTSPAGGPTVVTVELPMRA